MKPQYLMNMWSALIVVAGISVITGCAGGMNTIADGLRDVADNLSGTKTGKGGSTVTGSAGEGGTQGESKELVKCKAPIATVALAEDQGGYAQLAQMGLPSSPLPLVRLMLQQTGCFTIVDRAAGLRATQQEQVLSQQGMLRAGNRVKRGKMIEARYTITPHIIFSESNAGGAGAAAGAGMAGSSIFFPVGPVLAAAAMMAGSLRFKEAQVVLFLTDNNTTEQVGAASGSASATDIGIGGSFMGETPGAAQIFGNTAEGKVVAAALLDAVNKMMPHISALSTRRKL